MIRTHDFACSLPRALADALNAESGRIYTAVLGRHYRVYRKKGQWLSPGAGERVEDSTGPTLLHAHSRDAAQQGFSKACTTARTLRKQGDPDVRYPYGASGGAPPSERKPAYAVRPACCVWRGAVGMRL